jgi:23S rRNA pseudouridine2605 synthase
VSDQNRGTPATVHPVSEPVRIQKFLSRAGVASRREAERLVAAGRVTVNGEVVLTPGITVRPGVDQVALDGRSVQESAVRWIAFHKPPGVLTTRADPHGGKTIYDLLPDDFAGLRYVGRLDRDAEGLLLLTNDGDLAHALQHPSFEVERTYEAEVAGTVGPKPLNALRRGVALEDGPARPRRVEILEAGPVTSRVSLVLTEGRKREVRRLLAAVGHPVLRLVRTSFGPVELGELRRGVYRDLDSAEVAGLQAASGRSRD